MLFTQAVSHTSGSVVIATFPFCSTQYIEVSTRVLLTIFKADTGNVFPGLGRHAPPVRSKKHVHYKYAAFCKLSEPMGSNYIQARSKGLGCGRLLAVISGSYPVAVLDVCHLEVLYVVR